MQQRCWKLGRVDDALALLGPAAGTSGDPYTHALLVLALYQAGRSEDAGQAADFALRQVGMDAELARIASYVFNDLGESDKALTLATAAVASQPHWALGLIALARVQISLRNHPAAQAAISTALEVAPDDAEVHLVAGDIAAAGGWSRRARRHYLAALRLDPTKVGGLSRLGMLAQRRSQFGVASRCYAQVLAVDPGNAAIAAKVRGLFGQVVGLIAVAAMVLGIVVFIAFMSVVAPHGNTPNTAHTVLWSVFSFALTGALLWMCMRAAPRTVLDAFRSEVRLYRQARRAIRRLFIQLAMLAAAVIVAVLPGDIETRVGIVALILLVGFVTALVNMIGIQISFGYGGVRPASR